MDLVPTLVAMDLVPDEWTIAAMELVLYERTLAAIVLVPNKESWQLLS